MKTPTEPIPFNRSYIHPKMLELITQLLISGDTGGNGKLTKECQKFMEQYYHFSKVLLTPNCTQALELASILIDLQPDDEVIVPSYTFVSTANAFALRGAKIVLIDSLPDHPNLNHNLLPKLITSKTKAIVPVHYAGVACAMDKIMDLVNYYQVKHNQTIYVIEDAAQALDSYYQNKPLGGWGHFGCFSFHATKNISTGEGGALVINDPSFISRAEIIREKGTNRTDFLRGKIPTYHWVEIGSSYLPSEVTAACLLPQLQQLSNIKETRKKQWNTYYHYLTPLEHHYQLIQLPPNTPSILDSNYHIFYLICKTTVQLDNLIEYLKCNYITANRHYVPLHQSDYYLTHYTSHSTPPNHEFPNAAKYHNRLIRLPLYYDFPYTDWVIYQIYSFFNLTPPSHKSEREHP